MLNPDYIQNTFLLTLWKFQDISITQILREINFEDSRSAKSNIFAILGALTFVNVVDFSLQNVQIFRRLKNQNP